MSNIRLQVSGSTRRGEILKAICEFQKKHGRSPSSKELSDLTSFNRSTVLYDLAQLARAGCIRRAKKHGHEIVVVHRRIKSFADGAELTSVKKAAAGRQGRGRDINSPKRDTDLERRIDMVVRRALRQKTASGSDVIVGNDVIRLDGLRASRVG